MIESINKNIHFKSAPVAAVPPIQPPLDRDMTTAVPPVAAVTNPLERVPSSDKFVPNSTPTALPSPRQVYDDVVANQRKGAEAAFLGLTTSSALVQSAERGNKAASKQLDIIA